jgi:hypothetical protein
MFLLESNIELKYTLSILLKICGFDCRELIIMNHSRSIKENMKHKLAKSSLEPLSYISFCNIGVLSRKGT